MGQQCIMSDSELHERFDRKVSREAVCWLWTGAKSAAGYGQIRATRERKTLYAHVIAFKRWTGDVPEGMEVCHTCDVRHCVNPEHLFAGTRGDNLRDMAKKDRHSRGERNAKSKLTDRVVSQIRRSEETCRELAKRYGVAHQTISKAARAVTWKHNLLT